MGAHKSFCLERLVLKRSVVRVLAGRVFAVLLPVLAFHSILVQLRSALHSALRRMRISRHRPEPRNLEFAGEFGFDRAIEAYEELIDATLAERRA